MSWISLNLSFKTCTLKFVIKISYLAHTLKVADADLVYIVLGQWSSTLNRGNICLRT